jgi:hypothetical protein
LVNKISLPGCFSIGQESGSFLFPTKFVRILLPPFKIVSDIDVSIEKIKIVTNNFNVRELPIFPDQNIILLDEDNTLINIYNKSVYQSSEFFPSEIVKNVGIGYCRGYCILSLAITPLQFNPGLDELYFYPLISVDIKLEDSNYVNSLFRGLYDDQAWINNLVFNPGLIGEYSNIDSSFYDYPGGICDSNDSYDYVIITRSYLSDFNSSYNWTTFMSNYQLNGIKTKLVNIENILSCSDYWNSDPVFNDTAAITREFCKDAFLDWQIQYLLIAGDQENNIGIPRRLMSSNAEFNIETDLYWSNLDNTFNADHDSLWGEEGDSGFDLYSELFVGSLPCDEIYDISNWIEKTLRYQNSNDSDFLENAAFYAGKTNNPCEGDDFLDFIIYGTDNWYGPDPNASGPWPFDFLYGFDTWNSNNPKLSFNTSVRWTSENPNPGWEGGSESDALIGLRNAINTDNVTLLNGAMWISNPNMCLGITSSEWENNFNNSKPFFIYDYGSHCGDMDAVDDGVLHSLLFDSNTKLAFACILNTGHGWSSYNNTNCSNALQQKLFWDYLFNESKSGGFLNWQISKAHTWVKDFMTQIMNWDYSTGQWRQSIQSCTLFGDPALRLKPPNVEYSNRILDLFELWNLISIPTDHSIIKSNLSFLFNNNFYNWSEAINNNIIDSYVFGWNRTYQYYNLVDDLKPGYGYWIYAFNDTELWIEIISSTSKDFINNVESGWNIIGLPFYHNLSKSNLTFIWNNTNYTWDDAVSFGLVSDFIFSWDGENQYYHFADIIETGYAYWIYTYQPCKIKTK